jgi:hypothetical protein
MTFFFSSIQVRVFEEFLVVMARRYMQGLKPQPATQPSPLQR